MDNVKLTDPEEIIRKLNKLVERARNSDENIQQLEESLAQIEDLLAANENNYKEYLNFFAAILQELKDPNEHDRDLTLPPSKLVALTERLSRMQADLNQQQEQLDQERTELDNEKQEFEKQKTDRESVLAQMKEECRQKAEAEIARELEPLRTEITAKKAERQRLADQIKEAEKELEEMQQAIVLGSVAVPGPAGDRPSDMQKVLDEFDKEGYAAPSEIKPWGLYLCTQYAYIDITNSSNVMRSVLQQLDEEEFRFAGKPQIVFRRQNGGWFAFGTALPNTVNGKPLEREEETEIPQGAIIVMTDKKGVEHTVKVLIGM